tara:strand:+ start:574 stop:912 length:339 start_codon:yes stop_codon:yes gene_type:complete
MPQFILILLLFQFVNLINLNTGYTIKHLTLAIKRHHFRAAYVTHQYKQWLGHITHLSLGHINVTLYGGKPDKYHFLHRPFGTYDILGTEKNYSFHFDIGMIWVSGKVYPLLI